MPSEQLRNPGFNFLGEVTTFEKLCGSHDYALFMFPFNYSTYQDNLISYSAIAAFVVR
jgi:hypothetical protein